MRVKKHANYRPMNPILKARQVVCFKDAFKSCEQRQEDKNINRRYLLVTLFAPEGFLRLVGPDVVVQSRLGRVLLVAEAAAESSFRVRGSLGQHRGDPGLDLGSLRRLLLCQGCSSRRGCSLTSFSGLAASSLDRLTTCCLKKKEHFPSNCITYKSREICSSI